MLQLLKSHSPGLLRAVRKGCWAASGRFASETPTPWPMPRKAQAKPAGRPPQRCVVSAMRARQCRNCGCSTALCAAPCPVAGSEPGPHDKRPGHAEHPELRSRLLRSAGRCSIQRGIVCYRSEQPRVRLSLPCPARSPATAQRNGEKRCSPGCRRTAPLLADAQAAAAAVYRSVFLAI